MLPNFIIAGATRSGTTSLYYYLNQHPEISFPQLKEPRYFSTIHLKLPQTGPSDDTVDKKLIKSFEQYKDLYKNIENKMVGDASSEYLYHHTNSAKEIHKALGDIPIIVILRNPVERAFSAYNNLVRDDRESLDFEQAVEAEEVRKKQNWDMMWAYKSVGLYSEQVKTFKSIFSNVKVLIFDEFAKDPSNILKDVFEFLKVNPNFEVDTSTRYSHSGKPKNKLLSKLSSRQNKFFYGIRVLALKTIPRKYIEKVASKTLEKSIIPEKTKKSLELFFKDDIEKLESVINKDLTLWKSSNRKDKVRLGIVGFGRMGLTHYSIINSREDVEIVSIADKTGLIISLLRKYIPTLHLYDDYEDLIENSNIDALLVCTPPNLHYPIIKKASEKNLHVFCEKPYTVDKLEANELMKLYEEKNLVNQVGYVNRFNDIFIKVKEMLDNEMIGEVIRFKSEMFSNTISEPGDGSGWRAKHESGGGVVYEMAAHAIDLVHFLLGKPDKVVGSSLNNIYSKNVEDSISSTFLYESGKSGTIYVNWSDESYRKPTNKIEIFGKEGKILADQHGLKIYLKNENIAHKLREGWNTLYITDVFTSVDFYVRGNEFTRQLYHFIDCVKSQESNTHCSFRDGSNVIDVIDTIFNDHKTNTIL